MEAALPSLHLASSVPDLRLDRLAVHLRPACRVSRVSNEPCCHAGNVITGEHFSPGSQASTCQQPLLHAAASLRLPAPHLDAARRKLHADGRLGLQRELVAREAAEQVGLADARVADQHHLEQVVVAGAGGGERGAMAEGVSARAAHSSVGGGSWVRARRCGPAGPRNASGSPRCLATSIGRGVRRPVARGRRGDCPQGSEAGLTRHRGVRAAWCDRLGAAAAQTEGLRGNCCRSRASRAAAERLGGR